MSADTKTCIKCGEAKHHNLFSRQAKSKDGLFPYCKPCDKERGRVMKMKPEALSALLEKESLAKESLNRCTKCQVVKPFQDFPKRKDREIGIKSHCKACCGEHKREKWAAIPENQRKALSKARYAATSDQEKAKKREAYKANPEKYLARHKEWREKNHEYVKSKMREWHNENQEKANHASREHYKANKASYIAGNLIRKKARIASDPVFAMSERIRSLIYVRMRAGGYTKKSKSQEILGCDWIAFSKHIERQFLKGMTWDNKGDWCIDHIVPMATAKTEEDVIALNHFTNLRPMWAKDNLSKGARITHLI